MMRHLASVLLVFLLLAAPALAEERILAFHSDIEVLVDGSMQVTETITVHAEQQQIKRGIYRDFPTDYKDHFGNRYRVAFEVVSVLRDGRAEPWHTKNEGPGVRVYMGERDTMLAPGDYRYSLTYRTSRQLGFFDDHDELYWNVTGNDWAFAIERASARVVLPGGIPGVRLVPEAYTGSRGARGSDYRAAVHDDGAVSFATTRPFSKGEGLTIVVSWPKGYVYPPTTREEAAYLLRDNQGWVVLIGGLVLLLVYYLVAWVLVGRDPEEGVIITRYEPPPGLSPAAARYIRRMGYDDKTFVAALVNLAVKGLVTLREDDDTYVVERTTAEAVDLAAGEKAILKGLFNNLKGVSVPLKQSRHRTIGKALKGHEAALKLNSEKLYFVANQGWLPPGVGLSVLVFVGIIFALPNLDLRASGGFLSLWLTFWTFGVFVLATRVWQAWRTANSPLKIIGALLFTAFATPFFAAEIFVAGMLGIQVSPALPTFLLSAVGVNLLFHYLLKAPTRTGRNLLDQLEGFRQFLEVAEREEMNFRNPPEKTPELFEKFLPYALALGVEQHWMERFAGLFSRLEERGEHYAPVWYHGSHWQTANHAGFSESLSSSLSSAVASSSAAPGSSSGSGGGGSSGGGGGGGGGGGW